MLPNIDHLVNEAKAVLNDQNVEAVQLFNESVKYDTVSGKQQKFKMAIAVSGVVLGKFKIQQQKSLIVAAIHHYKYVRSKINNYLLLLKSNSVKDYEAAYLIKLLKLDTSVKQQNIDLYLKYRNLTLNSVHNSKRRQLLSGVSTTLENWFSILTNVFNHASTKSLLDKFTDTVKNHYVQIKKDQNANLNGSQMLNICDKIQMSLPAEKKIQKNKRSVTPTLNFNRSRKDLNTNNAQSMIKQIKEQDQRITKSIAAQNTHLKQQLEQKQDKMVQQIAQQVYDLKFSLEEEQHKIRAMMLRQKYLLMAIKDMKSSFYSLLKFCGQEHIEHESIRTISNIYKEFEEHVQGNISKQLKLMISEQDQKELIAQILKEETEHNFG